MKELAFASIADLGARLRAGRTSSLELTDLYLDRIAQLGPKLNAFVTVTADLARTEARRADADLAAGRDRGPLHGIPYAVKDLVDTAFVTTTWGCKATVDRIPLVDARIVTQLREAGAVLLGKLSLTELANALGNNRTSDNHNGPCRNPWDTTRWTGGSSSGAGAAVAAGLCAFAIGSETWGSIDCPSAYCGLTGLRPTFGVVAREGALVICPSLDKLGPIARSGEDAANVLRVLAPEVAATPTPARLRIGVVAGPASAPRGYLEAWMGVLATLGPRVALEPIELPKLPSDITMLVVLLAEVYAALDPFIRRGAVHELYDREPWETKWSSYLKLGLRADDYVKASYTRAAIQHAYRTLFERVDIVLAPGRPLTAPVIDVPEQDGESGGWGTLITDGNLIGAPAITMPMGVSDELPISVHAMAAPYDDAKLLALAKLFQTHTNHHLRRPAVS